MQFYNLCDIILYTKNSSIDFILLKESLKMHKKEIYLHCTYIRVLYSYRP